jgi:hypothetical protein
MYTFVGMLHGSLYIFHYPTFGGLLRIERWVHPTLVFQCFSTSRDGKKERIAGREEGENI